MTLYRDEKLCSALISALTKLTEYRDSMQSPTLAMGCGTRGRPRHWRTRSLAYTFIGIASGTQALRLTDFGATEVLTDYSDIERAKAAMGGLSLNRTPNAAKL
ncbi:MAG TPA: hypothetical protein VE154_00025 [Chthoniobacterales bacterium]|nr:hypothetical protein [Chthoniobacterales bacterium]